MAEDKLDTGVDADRPIWKAQTGLGLPTDLRKEPNQSRGYANHPDTYLPPEGFPGKWASRAGSLKSAGSEDRDRKLYSKNEMSPFVKSNVRTAYAGT